MFPLARIRDRTFGRLAPLMKQRRVRRVSAAVLFFVLLTTLLAVQFVPDKVNLKEGQVSPVQVSAPRSVVFEDKGKTEELREQAAAAVRPQYDRDPLVSGTVQRDIANTIAAIKDIQSDPKASQQNRVDRLKSDLPFTLPAATLAVLAQPASGSLDQVERAVNGLVAQVMETEQGVTPDKLDSIKKNLCDQVDRLQFSASYQNLAEGLINHYLRPNSFYNADKTHLLKQAAMNTVQPQMVTIKRNEIILRPGDVVTRDSLAKMEALGLVQPGLSWRMFAGSALLVALLMMVVLLYLHQQNREIYLQAGHLYLLGIIVVVVLAIAKAIVAINLPQWPELGALFGFMVPVAAAGMLIAILLDSQVAMLVVSVISFILTLMIDGQVNFGIVALVGGFAGVYSVSKLSQRGDLARAGVFTSAANVVAILIMGLLGNNPFGLVLTSALIFGLINGILSSVLTIGALPYLESAFGITSAVHLLELSQPSNPLLKRLLTEAPGTYHHSIIVGNLAEAAAEAVGGESLLVRVGAYYHDIGKIKRPYFFIENQMSEENPHDKIAPSLSTLILTSHVKDGVELAKEYKLPKAVVDIVEQHHGSGLCSYFYHKAMENGGPDNINEDEFRYEGPKPQTREAAIVLLADSVEAAVRSLHNPTLGRVEGMVRKIIKDKLMDGQLDECDLTFRDLDTIAAAFMQVLSGIFHSRIEYPDLNKELERRKARGVGARKQSSRKSAGG
ncbi:HD family phosphohydrolase [Desulfotomaculum copahuensis]|uniref:Phosphohydrolase n=1 Tax=Desulfotomaculum copahuensis TaxID=1838280 RepID=A0A1B7LHZ6_9FIRM|nr:HDIG domain-containing metalloprotein [Desulfotomaculum copahuensis]OAT85907.1 phosphohydrolase [Desulfotomaculum copahuensis]